MNWQYVDDTKQVVKRIDPLNGWEMSCLTSTPEIQDYIKKGGIIDPAPIKSITPVPTTDQKLATLGITKQELQIYLGLPVSVSASVSSTTPVK